MAEKPEAVPGLIARQWLIRGRVQGVGFRYFVARGAQSLGVSGWVSNLPDGRVEVRARGPAREIARLDELLRTGPPMSQVSAVDDSEISVELEMPKPFTIK